MKPAQPLALKLEKEWDRDLFGKKGLATLLGWESHWTFLSKGSRAGFPDRTLCRDRVIFVELKREQVTATPLTDPQRAWLDRLASAGAECYLWRPSDLDEIAQVLSTTWTFQDLRSHDNPAYTLRSATRAWRPKSLWIPGLGRADTTQQQRLDEGVMPAA